MCFGIIPHTRESLFHTFSSGVNAITGIDGLSLEIRSAENPEWVNTTIAFASISWATLTAPDAIASGKYLLTLKALIILSERFFFSKSYN